MALRTMNHPLISTKSKDGKDNGYLIPIFNVHDRFIPEGHHPQQVYLTAVSPGSVKGPHLHMKRWGCFTCIKGNIKVVARIDNRYEEYFSGEDHGYASIEIPAGTPVALQNTGDTDALVLNLPCPAWHIDDQDDHPASFDDYDFS